jgi:hypothetical protein
MSAWWIQAIPTDTYIDREKELKVKKIVYILCISAMYQFKGHSIYLPKESKIWIFFNKNVCLALTLKSFNILWIDSVVKEMKTPIAYLLLTSTLNFKIGLLPEIVLFLLLESLGRNLYRTRTERNYLNVLKCTKKNTCTVNILYSVGIKYEYCSYSKYTNVLLCSAVQTFLCMAKLWTWRSL